ncbi:hypothetical protein PVK63_19675 [Aliivibrio sp. S2TY2]|uniref:hypothetical protein n=1 Tax=unclassified Aliivibrio TaxID=2645654 RepID=UPI002379EB22|nr:MULTISPECIES: hypothetical protein [unclassified Aliivibrio]MDD9177067.1 hypothetical protein [Aliivibrio sp. S3TY1]MDD9194170.1 hypothetical protein [Aliivibrio sp. S2TY2]
MQKISVLVVPETKEFTEDVSHHDVVWINKSLGKPNLEGRNTKYLVPYWLKDPVGANRIYHILEIKEHKECYGIYLGNSFLLPERWESIAQKRRFEYWDLADFKFVEICPGLLTINL